MAKPKVISETSKLGKSARKPKIVSESEVKKQDTQAPQPQKELQIPIKKHKKLVFSQPVNKETLEIILENQHLRFVDNKVEIYYEKPGSEEHGWVNPKLAIVERETSFNNLRERWIDLIKYTFGVQEYGDTLKAKQIAIAGRYKQEREDYESRIDSLKNDKQKLEEDCEKEKNKFESEINLVRTEKRDLQDKYSELEKDNENLEEYKIKHGGPAEEKVKNLEKKIENLNKEAEKINKELSEAQDGWKECYNADKKAQDIIKKLTTQSKEFADKSTQLGEIAFDFQKARYDLVASIGNSLNSSAIEETINYIGELSPEDLKNNLAQIPQGTNPTFEGRFGITINYHLSKIDIILEEKGQDQSTADYCSKLRAIKENINGFVQDIWSTGIDNEKTNTITASLKELISKPLYQHETFQIYQIFSKISNK